MQNPRLPLRALLRELLEETLTIDGRSWTTIKSLPRPGELTERYLAGKRARFLGPVRLYLISSVLLFSTVLSLPTPSTGDINLYIGGRRRVAGDAVVVSAVGPAPCASAGPRDHGSQDAGANGVVHAAAVLQAGLAVVYVLLRI